MFVSPKIACKSVSADVSVLVPSFEADRGVLERKEFLNHPDRVAPLAATAVGIAIEHQGAAPDFALSQI
jgi:hypothetical protein